MFHLTLVWLPCPDVWKAAHVLEICAYLRTLISLRDHFHTSKRCLNTRLVSKWADPFCSERMRCRCWYLEPAGTETSTGWKNKRSILTDLTASFDSAVFSDRCCQNAKKNKERLMMGQITRPTEKQMKGNKANHFACVKSKELVGLCEGGGWEG